MSILTRMSTLSPQAAFGTRRTLYYGIAIVVGALIGASILFVPVLYILLGLGGLLFAYLLFFHVDLAVIMALLILEELRDFTYLGSGSPFHPNGLMGLALIFGAAWYFVFNKTKPSRLVDIKYFAGFVVVCFISLLFSGTHSFEGLTVTLRLLSGLAIYAVLVSKVDSIRQVVWVLVVVLISRLWLTAFDFANLISGVGSPFGQMGTARLGGGTSAPGSYLGMLLPFCLVFLFDAKSNGKRLLWGAISAIFLVGLFFSYGRAGWIAFVLTLLFLATVKYKRWWFIVPGLVLVAILALPQISERFADISLAQLGNRQSSTLAVRVELWQAGLEVFKTSNPLFGVGYGVERYRIGEYLSQYAYMAHNDYVAVLVGTGVVGLILFVLWHGQWLFSLMRVYRESVLDFDKTLALATLTFLFGSMIVRFTDNVVQTTGRIYPLAAMVAVTLILPRIRAEQAARAAAQSIPSDAPQRLSLAETAADRA